MDNELDRSIEELEAEVIQELEEANGADAPKKGAAPADKADKVDDKTSGSVEDTGPAVVSPTQKVKKPKSKEVSGDPAQKGEGKPDSMDKIKEDEDVVDSVDTLDEGSCSEMTKDEMQKEMLKAMKDMPKDQMEKLYASYMKEMDDEEEEDDEEDVAEKAKMKAEAVDARIKTIDVSDDVDALMNGEGDLSEEFKSKAATIFESAVKSKVRGEIDRIQGIYDNDLVEATETVKSELTDKIDSYLNYVVEEWMKENELAIERGLKGEIAEDFISGLKSLFEEHYIDVPDEKYDILGQQSTKIDEQEAKLNEQIEKSASLKSEKDALMRESVFAEVASDLADTEIEKFKSLAEDVEFNTEESFSEKLATLKESYFPKATTVAESVDAVDENHASFDTTGAMSAYMSAISRNVKRAK